jgi:hypothetical protein
LPVDPRRLLKVDDVAVAGITRFLRLVTPSLRARELPKSGVYAVRRASARRQHPPHPDRLILRLSPQREALYLI